MKLICGALTALAAVSVVQTRPQHPLLLFHLPAQQQYVVSPGSVYNNPARVTVVAYPQQFSPGHFIVSPPGVNYVPVVPEQNPVPPLSRDSVNFCRVVGDNLASPPSSALKKDKPVRVVSTRRGSDTTRPQPNTRQHIGPINLGYMCRRLVRVPVPGFKAIAKYCKRLAHTIVSNLPILLRQISSSDYNVAEVQFTGLYEHQQPQRLSTAESQNVAHVCQSMLQELATELSSVKGDVYVGVVTGDELFDDQGTVTSKPQATTTTTAKPEPADGVVDTTHPDDVTDTPSSTDDESTTLPAADVDTTDSTLPTESEIMIAQETVKPVKKEPVLLLVTQDMVKPAKTSPPAIAVDLTHLPVLPIALDLQTSSGIKFVLKEQPGASVGPVVVVSPVAAHNTPSNTFLLRRPTTQQIIPSA